MRVFIGFREVAGFFHSLRVGLERLGHQVSFVELTPHPYAYAPANTRPLESLAASVFRDEGSRWPGGLWLRRALRWLVFGWCVLTHDVFVFSDGGSFPGTRPHWCLRWLRWWGRKTVFLFLGSDLRPPFLDGSTGYDVRPGQPRTARQLAALTRSVFQNARQIEAEADHVISQSAIAQFLGRSWIEFMQFGTPTVIRECPSQATQEGPLRLLHAPSHEGVKGTAYFRAAVDRMRAEGFVFDYLELTGVPNDRVWEEIQRTDLIVDQIFSDIPMAGLAREGALASVPALVGGRAWPYLARWCPLALHPPVLLCTPETLDDIMRTALAGGRPPLQSAGQAARAFVENHFDCQVTAARLLDIIEGRAPAGWWMEPEAADYPCGAGLPHWKLVEMVATLAETTGPASLCLDDQPALLARLLRCKDDALHPAADTCSSLPPDVAKLVAENVRLQKVIYELEDDLKRARDKLDNFRGMIARRDRRIARLGGRRPTVRGPDSAS